MTTTTEDTMTEFQNAMTTHAGCDHIAGPCTLVRVIRRGDGPWHILPAERHGTTTCGRRLARFVNTVTKAALPEGATLCPTCAKHDTAGTFRPVGR